MASIPHPAPAPIKPADPERPLPPLEPGDHLDQKTFHARYKAMPDNVRAELVGGVVFMPSPLKRPHSKVHLKLGRLLAEYEEATPGTEALDNASTILGPESELQPDLCLLVTPARGGQTRDEEGYTVGPPELIAEVASGTESYDLHGKKRDYERAGVKEYVVAALRQSQVFWFVLRQGKFDELAPGPDGVFRSEAFPGLWLDPAALLRLDSTRLLEVLRQGLASPEHAAWVAELARR